MEMGTESHVMSKRGFASAVGFYSGVRRRSKKKKQINKKTLSVSLLRSLLFLFFLSFFLFVVVVVVVLGRKRQRRNAEEVANVAHTPINPHSASSPSSLRFHLILVHFNWSSFFYRFLSLLPFQFRAGIDRFPRARGAGFKIVTSLPFSPKGSPHLNGPTDSAFYIFLYSRRCAPIYASSNPTYFSTNAT